MKQKIKILNTRYFDFYGESVTIGGVQTYITNLAQVAEELGMTVEVYQFAKNAFERRCNNILVHGVEVNTEKKLERNSLILYKHCMKTFDNNVDLLIFGSDIMIPKIKIIDSLAIQHGIGWDIESETPCGRVKNIIFSLLQFRRSLIITKSASRIKKMICVDYNYINWYRTQILHHEMEYQIIPNFTTIPSKNLKKFDNDNEIRIIFARRLVKWRGTRLFSEVLERLLKEYLNLKITIAGEGPDEEFLKNKFQAYKNIEFIKYKNDESIAIHMDKHIAVVPTVGSEGTSLSLLEAMASSCAVICTNVGGMTNIIVDNFNGLIVNPELEQLYQAMKKTIEDCSYRKKLANMAYDTAKEGFSYECWKEKWVKVLKEY